MSPLAKRGVFVAHSESQVGVSTVEQWESVGAVEALRAYVWFHALTLDRTWVCLDYSLMSLHLLASVTNTVAV